MNYTLSPSSHRLKNNFSSFHEGHVGEAVYFCWRAAFDNSVESPTKSDAGRDICESSHLEQAATHTAPIMDCYGKSAGRPPRILRRQWRTNIFKQSWIFWNICVTVFHQPLVNHLLVVCQHSIPDIAGVGELHILSILCLFAPAPLFWVESAPRILAYLSFASL